MPGALADVVERFRRPEYTGERRCTPCTIVNAAIALVVAAVLLVGMPLDPVEAAVIAGAWLLVATAAIGLRGYLVPGTPQLTRTYLPDRVLRYFEHTGPGTAPTGDVDPVAVLEGAGAVTECEDVDDLCLTDDFRAAWRARIEARRDGDTTLSDLAAVVDLPERALAFEDYGNAFVALAAPDPAEVDADAGHRQRVGQWESHGAFVADMAGADLLRERSPVWSRLAPAERGQVLNGLRVFLEACPSCGGRVALGEETVESCCRSREVVAVTCDDCGARLFEAEAPALS